MDFSGDSLYNAVKTLVEDSLVHGLVIDIRSNYGGSFLAFYKTFKYLNSGDVSWLGEGVRSDPTNRLLMYNMPSSSYDLPDDDPNSFNNKIAILCGPGAGSSGDMFSVLFKHHPMVKTFGRSTEGAYGAIQFMTFTDASFGGSRQLGNFYEASNPSYYLTHTEFPIDSPMWYTRKDICNGTDNILNSAVRWIEPKLGVNEQIVAKPSVHVYPNPSGGIVNIVVSSVADEVITVRLCNMLGATLKTFAANLIPGEQAVKMDLTDLQLQVGSYYVVLQGARMGTITKKLTVVK